MSSPSGSLPVGCSSHAASARLIIDNVAMPATGMTALSFKRSRRSIFSSLFWRPGRFFAQVGRIGICHNFLIILTDGFSLISINREAAAAAILRGACFPSIVQPLVLGVRA
jgi:hypothetical protein